MRAAEEAIDSGAAASVLERYVECDAPHDAALDDLVEATRDALDRRKRERPLSELEREVETRARGPARSPRRCRAPARR